MKLDTGDRVMITCDGSTVPGVVLSASDDGRSLALMFDGAIAGYLRAMSVMRDRKGIYRTLSNTPIILRLDVGAAVTSNQS
jgi:hypothetical protein